jgi:hypothetical protein
MMCTIHAVDYFVQGPDIWLENRLFYSLFVI